MALTSAGMSPARAKASKTTPPPRVSPSSSSKSTSPDEIPPLDAADAILEASDGGIDPVTARVCSVVRNLATSTHTRASSRRDGDIADCARTPASARGASHDARHLNATTPPRDSSRTTLAAAILTPTPTDASSERNSDSVDDAAPKVTNAASVSPGASPPSARFLRVAASTAAAASSEAAAFASLTSPRSRTAVASSPSFDAAACNAAASAPAVSADVRAASTAAAVTPSATAVRTSPARSDHLASRVARATSPSNPVFNVFSVFGYSSRTDTAAGAATSSATSSASASASPFMATFTS